MQSRNVQGGAHCYYCAYRIKRSSDGYSWVLAEYPFTQTCADSPGITQRHVPEREARAQKE